MLPPPHHPFSPETLNRIHHVRIRIDNSLFLVEVEDILKSSDRTSYIIHIHNSQIQRRASFQEK